MARPNRGSRERPRVSVGTHKTKAAAEIAFAAAISEQQRGAWVAPEKGGSRLLTMHGTGLRHA